MRSPSCTGPPRTENSWPSSAATACSPVCSGCVRPLARCVTGDCWKNPLLGRRPWPPRVPSPHVDLAQGDPVAGASESLCGALVQGDVSLGCGRSARTTVFSSFLSVGMRGQGLAWSACEAVGRLDQSVEDAGFVERVPGVVDDVEFGFRPGPVQVVGGTYRGAHVVAALDDHTGDVTDGLDPVDELVRGEKTPVVEVMVLDPGEGQGVVLVGVVFTQARIGQQGDRRTFPHAPGTGRFRPRPPVRCVETSSVGRDEVVAFLLG